MASSARIDELVKKFTENPRRYFAPLANEYRKIGDLEQAIALCRAHLPHQPGHMSGHIVLGQALFESGALDESQQVLETALGLDPDNLIALRHLGDIARVRGDLPVARSWYQRVLDADPRNTEVATVLRELDTVTTPGGDPGAAIADTSADAGSSAPGSSHEELPAWGDVALGESATEAAGVSGQENPEHVAQQGAATADREEQPLPVWPDAPDEAPPAREHPAPTTSGSPADAPEASEPLALDLGAVAPSDASARSDASGPSEERAAARSGGLGETAGEVGGGAGIERAAAAEPEFESGEFVPPSASESLTTADGFESGYDDVLGGPAPHAGARGDPNAAGRGTGFVTETMAELYLQQGFFDEALSVYRQLLAQNPGDAGLRERIAKLEGGAGSTVSAGEISSDVIEAAQRRRAAPPRRTIRTFLGGLAGRRVSRGEDVVASSGSAASPERPTAIGGESNGERAANTHGAGPDAPATPIEAVADIAQTATDVASGAASAAFGLAAGFVESVRNLRETVLPDAGSSAGEPVMMAGDAVDVDPATTQPPAGASGPFLDDDDALSALFGGAPADADDERAAARLSGAFRTVSEPPPAQSGRPARAAKSELSLDHVFRESSAKNAANRQRDNFSFDQFFSADENAGTTGEHETRASGEPNPDDIGQFNDWLESLKRK